MTEEYGWRGTPMAYAIERWGVRAGLIVHGPCGGVVRAAVPALEPSPFAQLRPAGGFIVTCLLLGIVLGWLRLRSRSIAPPTIANAPPTIIAGLPLLQQDGIRDRGVLVAEDRAGDLRGRRVPVPRGRRASAFHDVNEFRKTHWSALADLLHQVLQLCRTAGLVKLGHVAIGGSKMKANASKHKAMSYERMEKDEARLKAEVEALLAQADATDAAEDARYGSGSSPATCRPAGRT